MTPVEIFTLQFIDEQLSVTPHMIGSLVYTNGYAKGSNLIGIGASVLGRLRKQGFVHKLPDINQWRISMAGREAIEVHRR